MAATIARFLEVGDILTAGLNGFFATRTPASRAARVYAVSIGDVETAGYVAESINLRAFVVPDVPKWEILSRGKNLFDYPFNVLFFEKCTDQTTSPPPNSWTDKRALLVDQVMREFGDMRKPLTGDLQGLRVESSEYTIFADQSELREEGCFWCEIALMYREDARV